MGGQDCDGSVSQQAPIRSLPTRPTDSNLMESLGRADRSTQRHELAGRNEGQIQPSDTVIMLTVVRAAHGPDRRRDAQFVDLLAERARR